MKKVAQKTYHELLKEFRDGGMDYKVACQEASRICKDRKKSDNDIVNEIKDAGGVVPVAEKEENRTVSNELNQKKSESSPNGENTGEIDSVLNDKINTFIDAFKSAESRDMNKVKILCNLYFGYGNYDIVNVGKEGQCKTYKIVIKDAAGKTACEINGYKL